MSTKNLTILRAQMRQHQIAALIIPTADPHLSEYLPHHWQARDYFSGFTGSAGVLVVQPESAQLWTDFRYWEQAEAELSGSGITLEEQQNGRNHIAALAQTLPENARVAIASDMLSLAEQRHIQAAFADKNITLCCDYDIAAEVWGEQRPALPTAPVFAQKAQFVPQTAAEKLNHVREKMRENGAQWHLISALDDIAWLTNLRGNDIEYNPVFLSHLLIGENGATLFVSPDKISADIQAALNAAQIQVAPYESVAEALAELSGCLMFDPNKIAVSTVFRLPENVKIVEKSNPSSQFKAEKCATEVANIRTAMLQDGIALCGFFADFEARLANGDDFNEYDINAMLLKHRSQREHFVSESFGTIAGFNANGSMPHYSAPVSGSLKIAGDGLLLIDSGAQYHSGTTDITRVVPVGKPSAAQIHDFTLVLKAHIALAQAVFPEGIMSPMLDAICRQPMWQAQCDFGHGTGHGVGYFLNVHEGPQRISYHAQSKPEHALREGMLTSNEPGLYRPNQWGIRIENLVVAQRVSQPEETAFGKFLCFETVTLCPIDTRLVDVSLLNENERGWLNGYHAKVREAILPFVDGAAKDWLVARTVAI
ncbi:aminopeptidase P family protein [Kingella negevensis]|uniref:aminopeptidase P family protein n=1 Tax=Kingella negevensis TaxID=1522312 RepID=UPI00050A21FD|nr:aminopeptidase P family protein [Kingella negevensis]MDK4688989.1 aminopeptidase P family protein [Kingella negevensis]WII90577.1 aminopeptidase P family protein [Kingella negevensis]